MNKQCLACRTDMPPAAVSTYDLDGGSWYYLCNDKPSCHARAVGRRREHTDQGHEAIAGHARLVLAGVMDELRHCTLILPEGVKGGTTVIGRLEHVDRVLRLFDDGRERTDDAGPLPEASDSARVKAMIERLGKLEARVLLLEQRIRPATGYGIWAETEGS